MLITPGQSVGVTAGTSVYYTVAVKNNDGPNCPAATFSLQKTVPSGWTSTFSSSSLSTQPGATVSTILTVTSPVSAPGGVYSLNITAANSAGNERVPYRRNGMSVAVASSAATALTTATYVIDSALALALTVTTDHPSYSRQAWISITAEVRSAGQPVAKADVTFTITKPDGKLFPTRRATETNGDAVYRFSLPVNDPLGIYQVSVTASQGTVKFGPTTTSFLRTP